MERATFANGLRIAVARMPRLPLVTVLAQVDAGVSRDPAGAEGIASLAARGLREGTERLDGAALTEHFELLGTGLDVGSDWDSAVTEFTVTSDRLDAAIGFLGEVLTTPAFLNRWPTPRRVA